MKWPNQYWLLINSLGKVNSHPQCSDISSLLFFSFSYVQGNWEVSHGLSNTDRGIRLYRALLILQGHAIDCLGLLPDLMNKLPDLVVLCEEEDPHT